MDVTNRVRKFMGDAVVKAMLDEGSMDVVFGNPEDEDTLAFAMGAVRIELTNGKVFEIETSEFAWFNHITAQ